MLAEICAAVEDPERLRPRRASSAAGRARRASPRRSRRSCSRSCRVRRVAGPNRRRARRVGGDRHARLDSGAAPSRGCRPSAELRMAVASVRRTHWTLDRPRRDGDAHERRAARAQLLHQELHRRSRRAAGARGARRRAACSSTSAATSSCAATGRRPSASPIRWRTPTTARRSPQLVVRDRAVATSGGYKRGFDIAGQHYSHIVDPRTAQPTGHVLSATVVAPGAVDAGALATAFCVLTPDESVALARTRARRRVPAGAGGRPARRERRLGPRSRSARPARPLVESPVGTLYAAEQSTGPLGQLTIALELARAGRHGAPAVRGRLDRGRGSFPGAHAWRVWYDGKTRYLPELRAWYRGDRLRAMAEGTQIVERGLERDAHAGQVHPGVGRQGQRRQARGGRHYTVLHRSRRASTAAIRLLQAGHGVLRRAEVRVTCPAGAEVSAAILDYHKADGG